MMLVPHNTIYAYELCYGVCRTMAVLAFFIIFGDLQKILKKMLLKNLSFGKKGETIAQCSIC